MQALAGQIDSFELTAWREDGQEGTLTYTDDTEAAATGMPYPRIYTLLGEHAGTWIFEASCTVDGEVLTASGTVTRADREEAWN